jgi:hypothetical protein
MANEAQEPVVRLDVDVRILFPSTSGTPQNGRHFSVAGNFTGDAPAGTTVETELLRGDTLVQKGNDESDSVPFGCSWQHGFSNVCPPGPSGIYKVRATAVPPKGFDFQKRFAEITVDIYPG